MKKIYNIACELMERHLEARCHKTAILYQAESISYGRLQEQINRFGNVLRELGVAPGERVVIALPDCPEGVCSFLGSIKVGAWPILLSPQLTGATYEFILNDSQGAVLFTVGASEALQAASPHLRHRLRVDEDAFAQLLEQASSELAPHPSGEDDIAFLLYSSGSTGNPKGVPHRHRDMAFTADVYAGRVLGMCENDLCFSASKLFFAYGLGNSLAFPLFHGASVVLFPDASIPMAVLEVISQYRPTLFFGIPTLYHLLLQALDETVSLASLRLCISAGEALPAAVYHRWKALTGLEILDGIGSTEALHIFISNRPGAVRPGAAGFLIPPYEARLVDDQGLPVAPGQPGHLHIRGISTAPYYWNQPERTAETMIEDGWLRTGDIFVQEAGCYTYQGRSDDMFKVGGNWVSPIRVEEVIREVAGVSECAVTWHMWQGLASPIAFVVLNPGAPEEAALARVIRSHVLQRLPASMCPTSIEFLAELPKTETGKVRRFLLRG